MNEKMKLDYLFVNRAIATSVTQIHLKNCEKLIMLFKNKHSNNGNEAVMLFAATSQLYAMMFNQYSKMK